MIRPRSSRPMLALTVVPVAAGVVLGVAGSASATTPSTHAAMVGSARSVAVVDDHGGQRDGRRDDRSRTPADDHGGRHPGRSGRHGGGDDGPHHS